MFEPSYLPTEWTYATEISLVDRNWCLQHNPKNIFLTPIFDELQTHGKVLKLSPPLPRVSFISIWRVSAITEYLTICSTITKCASTFMKVFKNPAKKYLVSTRFFWILSLPHLWVAPQRPPGNWGRNTWKPHIICSKNNSWFAQDYEERIYGWSSVCHGF